MSKTIADNNTVEWKDLNWKQLERDTFKLQNRIYRAEIRDDVKTVRKLQKTLIRSWKAKCIAVRKVTQDNQGKKTSGIDGISSLNSKERMKLVNNLKISDKAEPTRRIWIPKANGKEMRPLEIPTIRDRALQALVKMALEPEWEAKFEPNSYGFRPSRTAHDAINQIFSSIKQKSKYVLDADIEKCFDKINHEKLLDKTNTFPTLRQQIKAWLQAGILEKGVFCQSETGTPQGGVISPLLANIALHGMEELITINRPAKHINGKWVSSPTLVRYADDFVIIHEDKKVVLQCKAEVQQFLKEIGLNLKEEKTKLVHTLEGENVGFDFLGFNIRQYHVNKHNSARSSHGKTLGFATIIKPSKKSIKRHIERISEIISKYKAMPQERLILKLNPVISGWSRYYSTVNATKSFSYCDHITYLKLWRWACRRHVNKGKYWIKDKYWNKNGEGQSKFQYLSGDTLTELEKHTNTKCNAKGYVKVKGSKSPYDGDYIYWASRMGKHPMMTTTISKLLKRQKGKCQWCENYFQDGDILEKDHIKPISKGGKKTYRNLQLLHRHCHDVKTSTLDNLYSRKEA